MTLLDTAIVAIAFGAALASIVAILLGLRSAFRVRTTLQGPVAGATEGGKITLGLLLYSTGATAIDEKTNNDRKVVRSLVGFVIVALIFVAIVLYIYRDRLPDFQDQIILGVALYMIILLGMIMGTLKKSYEDNKKLLDGIDIDALWLPVILSPMIFFIVWLAKTDEKLMAAAYAALLSGFTWEQVVGAIQAPVPPSP